MPENLHNDHGEGDRLENFFRNSLENFEDEPSFDLWDRIEKVIPPKPKKRPHLAVLWQHPATKWLAAAVVTFAFLGMGYQIFVSQQNIEQLAEEVERLKKTSEQTNSRPYNGLIDSIVPQIMSPSPSPSIAQPKPSSEETIKRNNNTAKISQLARRKSLMASSTIKEHPPSFQKQPNVKQSAIHTKITKNQLPIATIPTLNSIKKQQANNVSRNKNIGISSYQKLTEKNDQLVKSKSVLTPKVNQSLTPKSPAVVQNKSHFFIKETSNLITSLPTNELAETQDTDSEVISNSISLETKEQIWSLPQDLAPISANSIIAKGKKAAKKALPKTKSVKTNKQMLPDIPIPPTFKSNNKFYVGGNITPFYAGRSLQAKDRKDPKDCGRKKDEINRREQGQWGIGADITLGYHISDKWRIQTGLGYRRIKQMSHHEIVTDFQSEDDESDLGNAKYELETSYGHVSVNSRIRQHRDRDPDCRIKNRDSIKLELATKQSLHYTQLPISAQYKLLENNFLSVNIEAGLVNNFLVDAQVDVLEESVKIKKRKDGNIPHPSDDDELLEHEFTEFDAEFEDLQKYTLGYQIGASFDVKLSDRMNVTLNPTYQQSITPVFNEHGLKTKPYTFGVGLGVSYKL